MNKKRIEDAIKDCVEMLNAKTKLLNKPHQVDTVAIKKILTMYLPKCWDKEMLDDLDTFTESVIELNKILKCDPSFKMSTTSTMVETFPENDSLNYEELITTDWDAMLKQCCEEFPADEYDFGRPL
jgi:hypothetical protein